MKEWILMLILLLAYITGMIGVFALNEFILNNHTFLLDKIN